MLADIKSCARVCYATMNIIKNNLILSKTKKGKKMGFPVVLVHGWGCGPDFWAGMSGFFPQNSVFCVDLGFVGREGFDHEKTEFPAVYITHSLGTLWALKYRRESMAALIAINGFPWFRPFASLRTLDTMKRRLIRDPAAQMHEFYAMCGIGGAPPASALDAGKLEEGLDWLGAWDEREILSSLNVPVLCLAGDSDPLLPLEEMKKLWHGFPLCVKEGGGHALPQTHCEWCARTIQGFLCERGLEIQGFAEF